MKNNKIAGLFDLLVRDDGSDPPEHHDWRVRVEQHYDKRRVEVALSLGLDATASWTTIIKLRRALRHVDSNGAQVPCVQRNDCGPSANAVCYGIGRSKMTLNLHHV